MLCGKVDMPYIELVLTTRCTLNCASCGNMMQYFSRDNQYTCSFEAIQESLEMLLSKVDSIGWVRIIGGEPLLFKDLPKVVRLLDSLTKIKSYDIVTNATINFKEELLVALKDSHKAMISISDYSISPNITKPLHAQEIIHSLKHYDIVYSTLFNIKTDASRKWFDFGKVYKRGRDKAGIIKNFDACRMSCVSLMTSEGLKLDSNATDSTIAPANIAPKGGAFLCPRASSLSRLRGLDEFIGDFINIANDSKDRILAFYAQDFYKVCDYCQDMWEEKKPIPIAIQTKQTLALTQ